MLEHETEADSKLLQRARTINHNPPSIQIFKDENVSKSILAYFHISVFKHQGSSQGHVSKSHEMVDMHVGPTPPHNLLSLRTCRTPQPKKKKTQNPSHFLFPQKNAATPTPPPPICNDSPKSNFAINHLPSIHYISYDMSLLLFFNCQ